MKKYRICSVILLFIGCMFALSCGQRLSEQELNDLESRAEKGDKDAAIELYEYLGNSSTNSYSLAQEEELREKAKSGDKEAQEKYAPIEKGRKQFEKATKLAAEAGHAQAAFFAALDCYYKFNDRINIKENKKSYKKYMEIAIKAGYKDINDDDPITDTDGCQGDIDTYKKHYQNKSEEWWNSDSI